jgi:hypothetical protein
VLARIRDVHRGNGPAACTPTTSLAAMVVVMCTDPICLGPTPIRNSLLSQPPPLGADASLLTVHPYSLWCQRQEHVLRYIIIQRQVKFSQLGIAAANAARIPPFHVEGSNLPEVSRI